MTATSIVALRPDQAGGLSDVRGLRWIPGVLSPHECRHLVDAMAAAPGPWATTSDNDGRLVVDRRRRSVRHARLAPDLTDAVAARLHALIPHFAAVYHEPLAAAESPQFLTYEPGDGYSLHRDAPLDPGPGPRRRLSLVLFLNADFEGGALRLHHTLGAPWIFEPTIEPGALVVFRSTTLHEVAPVHAGTRRTIACWYF